MATMQPDPAEGQDDDTVDASQGYTIEVKVSGDGSITVCVEPASEEAAEEGGEGQGDDDDAQPVSSIREACKLVMQIFNSQGQAPDASQDQADMSAGYGKD